MNGEIYRDLKFDKALEKPQKLKLEARPPIPGSETKIPNVFEEEARRGLAMGQDSTLKPAPSPWEGVPVKSPNKKTV